MLRAQTTPDPVVTLDRYVVQGRESDLLGQAVAASDGFVGSRELAARPWLRRGELLEAVPGVVVTQHSGGGKANQYFLRGFNLDHGTDFAVFAGGVPVNLRSHAHGQGYADLNFIIPELVESIRYRKGTYAADQGNFSTAGSAELAWRDVIERSFVTLEMGEDGYARGVIAGSVRDEAGHGVTTAAVEHTRNDGPWELAEDFRRTNAFAAHRWQAGNLRWSLTALGSDAEWVSTDQIPLRAVEAGALGRFGFIDPTDGGESSRYSLTLAGERNDSEGSAQVTVFAVRSELNLFSNFTYFLDDPVNGDQFNQREKRWLVGANAKYEWQREWAGRRVDLTAGLETRGDLIDGLSLSRTRARELVSVVRSDEVSEWSAAAFAQAEVRWNERWRATAGLRVDAQFFDVESDTAVNSGNTSDALASPKFSLVYAPTKTSEIYLSAGTGFHSNDARGTVIRVDPVSGDPVERVEPLVRTEGAELGLRFLPAKGWVSTVSVWGLELDSELVFVGDAGGTEPTGATRRYGVEWANFYRVKPWLGIDADVSFSHGRYREGPDDRIANSIAQVVAAGVTVGEDKGLYGTARLRYFGEQPLIEDNSIIAPSSTTVNARLGWRAKDWEVALDVLNALDRENYDIAYAYTSRLPGEPTGGVDDVHFHPAEPRTVRLSATWRF